MGRDFSGTVVAIGEKVKGSWSIGDEVFGLLFQAVCLCLKCSIFAVLRLTPCLVWARNVQPIYCRGPRIGPSGQEAGQLVP
jgi:hypothetical protein